MISLDVRWTGDEEIYLYWLTKKEHICPSMLSVDETKNIFNPKLNTIETLFIFLIWNKSIKKKHCHTVKEKGNIIKKKIILKEKQWKIFSRKNKVNFTLFMVIPKDQNRGYHLYIIMVYTIDQLKCVMTHPLKKYIK